MPLRYISGVPAHMDGWSHSSESARCDAYCLYYIERRKQKPAAERKDVTRGIADRVSRVRAVIVF